jgi:hypothetical protein
VALFYGSYRAVAVNTAIFLDRIAAAILNPIAAITVRRNGV